MDRICVVDKIFDNSTVRLVEKDGWKTIDLPINQFKISPQPKQECLIRVIDDPVRELPSDWPIENYHIVHENLDKALVVAVIETYNNEIITKREIKSFSYRTFDDTIKLLGKILGGKIFRQEEATVWKWEHPDFPGKFLIEVELFHNEIECNDD
jgi:hypothetical protein